MRALRSRHSNQFMTQTRPSSLGPPSTRCASRRQLCRVLQLPRGVTASPLRTLPLVQWKVFSTEQCVTKSPRQNVSPVTRIIFVRSSTWVATWRWTQIVRATGRGLRVCAGAAPHLCALCEGTPEASASVFSLFSPQIVRAYWRQWIFVVSFL